MAINEKTIEKIVAIPLLPENILVDAPKIMANNIIQTPAFKNINAPLSPVPKRKLNML